ncbi:proline dehydrogenase [Candidatus Nitrososphaera evergladensis SR1]|uniref:proline dehydrogenase n=1 Tax=Candidatus Nitrososphaera evergladensis SR1 TaxID=1459636 RepID=A0A075MV91_9ARCH|nr:proline dehydrogenase family protein [Candidatus Nitrososphaera evergladensis]AIF85566.1 proline dehydrogenase [Candidatus Nitrososphaera evergladensis SR1]
MKRVNVLLTTTAATQALHSHSYDSSLLERLLFRVAKRWVAGYSADEAINAALDANRRGMSAILNFLGEDVVDKAQVGLAVREYLSLMDLTKAKGVRGCVSAKPTQLGLAVDYDMCLQNFIALAKKAEELGQFLWIDMESAKFTEDTITIYLEVLKEYPMTGVAIQAYLRRSGADILHIIEHGGKVRLVKGAYHEPEEHAFTTEEEVDGNYSHLLKMLADGGNFFAVATHDGRLVDEAANLQANNCEFQMLMGIRDELKSQLVSRGLPVSEYIPYGSQWLPYSVRRIRERKRNLLLLARSLVQS